MEKLYTLFTDTSHCAYSGVLNQAVNSPEDLRLIAYTPGSFSNGSKDGLQQKKEAFAIHQSVLKFDLYLKGAECILYCNHKPLETFLTKGIKIPMLNRWSMELADYNITFVHIKGKNNLLVGAISRLKMLYIYKEPVENPK